MKKISFLLMFVLLITVLSGCSLSVNGKKVISVNEDKKLDWSVGNNRAEKTEVKNLDTGSAERVSINNAAGEITFAVWDKNDIQVTALKKIRGGEDEKKLNELLDEIKVIVEKNSDVIDVNVKYINTKWGIKNQSVNLQVMLPSKIVFVKGKAASGDVRISGFDRLEDLNLSSVSGNVEVRNVVSKELSLDTTSGNVFIDSIKSDGNIHTVSGDVVIKKTSGSLNIKTTSGPVTATDLEGGLNSSTVSGSVNVKGALLKSSDFHTTSGSVNVSASKIDNSGEYKFSTVSGEVCFILPQDAGFRLNASSTSGDIRNEFEIVMEGSTIKRREIKGLVGTGGPEINIRTVSGEIDVKKQQ